MEEWYSIPRINHVTLLSHSLSTPNIEPESKITEFSLLRTLRTQLLLDSVFINMEFGFPNTLIGNIGNNFLSGARIGGRTQTHYDAVVIGAGIGGLVAATQLAVKGARVLVLEKDVFHGGSYGFYQREGYNFDVGSSVMFGFSDKPIIFPKMPERELASI